MNKLLTFLFLSLCFLGFSQEDTLFFDADWNVCAKEKASYYRLAEFREQLALNKEKTKFGDGYLITDYYYPSHKLQMVAYSWTINPADKFGTCTFYYPNGKKSSEGTYTDNIKTGIWTEWDEDGENPKTKNCDKKYAVELISGPTSNDLFQDSMMRYNSTPPVLKTDTLYFDSDWVSSDKKDAIFYRVLEPVEGGWNITDYYAKRNTPFLKTFSKEKSPLKKQGKSTYYYLSGKKSHEGTFENNVFTGVWTFWPENGADSTQSDYTPRPKVVAYKQSPLFYNRYSDYIAPETPPITSYDTSLYKIAPPDQFNTFELAARGKVFGMFIIEDAYILTYTVGLELGFRRRHFLGLDYTWFKYWTEDDDSHDVGMYDEHELKTYLHADYKFVMYSAEDYAFNLYLNAYDKFGKYRKWYDPLDYDFGKRDMTFLQSTISGPYNEPGLGLGIRLYDEEYGLGFDTSINGGIRFTDYNERIYFDQYDSEFRDHVKHQQGVFYWRINLFYNFCH